MFIDINIFQKISIKSSFFIKKDCNKTNYNLNYLNRFKIAYKGLYAIKHKQKLPMQ